MMSIMGDYKEYMIQARINEELVLFLNKNCNEKSFFNWIFVVLYYSAYHYFCSLLSYKGDKIPISHKSRGNSYIERGDVDLALDKLVTTKNNRTDAAGTEYEQLYQWSCDIRYNPKRTSLFIENNLNVALKHLEGIKFVVFNEIGLRAIKERKKIKIVKIKDVYLDDLFEMRKRL